MEAYVKTLGAGPDLQYGRRYVWQLPVRVTHWVNAISIPVLMITGVLIARPTLTPVGEAYRNFWMGRIREIHFIFAYALIASLILRLYWFFVGNNYARSGFPLVWRRSWWKALIHQVIDYTHIERGQVLLGHNSLAGLAYFGFFMMCAFEGLTGFALYGQVNPGGFWDTAVGWSIPLLGGSFAVHTWHHLVAWGCILFTIFHLYIVIYDSSWYRDGLIDGMTSGFKFYEKGDIDHDQWVS